MTAYDLRISDWISDVCSSVLFEVRHRRDLGFAITLPFDIATRTYLALVNDQSAVTKHMDVGQQIARVAGTFAATPIADECGAIRFGDRAQLGAREIGRAHV